MGTLFNGNGQGTKGPFIVPSAWSLTVLVCKALSVQGDPLFSLHWGMLDIEAFHSMSVFIL